MVDVRCTCSDGSGYLADDLTVYSLLTLDRRVKELRPWCTPSPRIWCIGTKRTRCKCSKRPRLRCERSPIDLRGLSGRCRCSAVWVQQLRIRIVDYIYPSNDLQGLSGRCRCGAVLGKRGRSNGYEWILCKCLSISTRMEYKIHMQRCVSGYSEAQWLGMKFLGRIRYRPSTQLPGCSDIC